MWRLGNRRTGLSVPLVAMLVMSVTCKRSLLTEEDGKEDAVTSNHTDAASSIEAAFQPDDCDDLEPVDLLVLIDSKAAHFEQRLAIRETWAPSAVWDDEFVKIVFLLEEPQSTLTAGKVYRENVLYDDILQIESSPRGRLKHSEKLRAGLEWAAKSCGQSQFVLVSWDDVFVDVATLLEYLRDELSPGKWITGCVSAPGSRPLTSKEGDSKGPIGFTGNLLGNKQLETYLLRPASSTHALPADTHVHRDKRFNCKHWEAGKKGGSAAALSCLGSEFTVRAGVAAELKKAWSRASACAQGEELEEEAKASKKRGK